MKQATIRIEFEEELQDLTHLIVDKDGYVLEAGRLGAKTIYKGMQVAGFVEVKPGDKITLWPSSYSTCKVDVPIRYIVESIKNR